MTIDIVKLFESLARTCAPGGLAGDFIAHVAMLAESFTADGATRMGADDFIRETIGDADYFSWDEWDHIPETRGRFDAVRAEVESALRGHMEKFAV